ncbi:hypothetical protein E0H88_06860 [Acinetobacter sp. ANC 4216]|uniref:hypothetical protein n=1 Tax=Acinetobacter sp. ANC 4216 TaxID=2529840 RepID=UPI00103DBDA0|nr:hypothetical protein [Acinetobacter sp. ANC 4216]TCB71019.1 hypothetical protein E0H88_06860 [Acinetobacter sp. ANC 4216]
MHNFIKLLLIASGFAIMMLYPMGSLFIVLPSSVFLSPFNYLQALGIEAAFALGFLISAIVLLILSVPQRYPYGKGFILLGLGLISYIIFQVYKYEVSFYAFNHRNVNAYHVKYLIELIIFLFNFLGLIFIYHSNLPKQIDQFKKTKNKA